MKATLKDIAERVGVSQMTVSNVIRDTGRVSDATRKRVMNVCRELGYAPNAGALAMRRQRFGNIGLLLSDSPVRSMLPEWALDGIYNALRPYDEHLVMAPLPDQKLTDAGYVPRLLREFMVDGLLINYNAAIPAEMHDLIVDSHHPSIWMNSKQHADCIYPDDYSGAKMIAQRMLALGHRRIAFVDFSNRNVEAPLHYSGTDRLAGVQDACSQAGATFIRHGWGELAAAGHETPVARDLLSGPDRPTAVVAYTMQEARFIRTAALDVRLDVPNDLSIAAIASGRARAYDRTISAASIPFYELGKQAVEMLHEKIDVPEASLEPRPLPMTWEEGDSMAEAPTDDEGNAA